jgi:hypothetical protein
MVRALMALVLGRVFAWLVWSNEHAKDLEIVVLRLCLLFTPSASSTLNCQPA